MLRPERRSGLAIAVVALWGALAPAPPESPAKSPPVALAANIALAREQLKLIEQIQGDLDRKFKSGELSATDGALKLWARRKLDAIRATGVGKDRIVAELEGYLNFMRTQEAAWKSLYQRDQATRVDLAAAQYERLEAEMLLNQEKAR
jgi:hypothetical protein